MTGILNAPLNSTQPDTFIECIARLQYCYVSAFMASARIDDLYRLPRAGAMKEGNAVRENKNQVLLLTNAFIFAVGTYKWFW